SLFVSVCTSCFCFFLINRLPPASTLFPYTTLFRSVLRHHHRNRRLEHRHGRPGDDRGRRPRHLRAGGHRPDGRPGAERRRRRPRSEEHTSELQSRENLVCRLLLEKKKKKNESPHMR